MNRIGPQGTNLPNLFDVLSGRPNLNEVQPCFFLPCFYLSQSQFDILTLFLFSFCFLRHGTKTTDDDLYDADVSEDWSV
jgi:hypothetical protein